MHNSQKFQMIHRAGRILSISILLFMASSNHAIAYGGHGYNSGHSNVHHGYRHNGHHRYRGHYSHRGHIGTAGYVFIGVLSAVILSQIFDNDNDRDRRHRNTPSHSQAPTQQRNVSVDNKSKSKQIYSYSDNEGWNWLAKGNTSYALDIFAIQSQQNLDSGIPKIGFALSAAANGDTDRATRAMRKAIRIDVNALDKINTENIKPTIERLAESYKLNLHKNNTDNSFMMATLSYLQQDYATASNIISEKDQSQSTNNLRELIAAKES